MTLKPVTEQFYQYINGTLEQGASRTETILCPGSGERVADVGLADIAQVNRALEAARDAFPAWSALPLEERGKWMMRLCDAVREERESLLTLLLLETGKLRSHDTFETDSLINYLTFFLEQAKCGNDEILRDNSGGHGLYMTVREPVGVVVASLAWNFPLHNVATKLAPILASGCTAVIKPATRTPLATLYLGALMHRIGFPKGVVNIIAGSAAEIGGALSASTIPAMITMIGSTSGGLEMMRDSTTSVKRFSMELGGNAPVIVTETADWEAAALHTMANKMRCAGQTCVAPQRVFVNRRDYDRFVAKCAEIGDAAKCGMGDEDANIGALISPAAVGHMARIVADAQEKGATVVCGGRCPENKKGCYYLPTVLTGVTTDMLVFREEVFGPVMCVMPFDALDEAITLANDTEYGLSSYVWATDYEEISQLSRRLRFGIVNVNAPGTGAPYPHGGCKNSGVGKDGSHYSLDEYYYVKGIRIALKGKR